MNIYVITVQGWSILVIIEFANRFLYSFISWNVNYEVMVSKWFDLQLLFSINAK